MAIIIATFKLKKIGFHVSVQYRIHTDSANFQVKCPFLKINTCYLNTRKFARDFPYKNTGAKEFPDIRARLG